MRLVIAATILVLAVSNGEEETHRHDGHPAETSGSPHHPHLDLEDQEDGWFHLHPHLSAAIAIGASSSEKNFGLIQGGHAPIDDGFNLQGVEFGAVMELGSALSIHSTVNAFWDRFDHWDLEAEEVFAALEMPGGVSFRGGQFFTPFGYENSLHLHDRVFVEPPISLVRLLGEDGLVTQGGELAFHFPGGHGGTIFRFGYGNSSSHNHGGNRESRRDAFLEATEQHEEEEDHEEEEHHSHGLAGNGGVYEADRSYLSDGVFFARLERDLYGPSLENAGLSFAAGENGFGRTTWVIGGDVKGNFEINGRPSWWRAEAFHRTVHALDEAGLPGHFDETGIYASLGCEFVEDWTAAARLEWASGNRMSGNERRTRASANLSHLSRLAEGADLHSRLQYSYDDLGGYGADHTVWLQFVLNLGAAEHGHEH